MENTERITLTVNAPAQVEDVGQGAAARLAEGREVVWDFAEALRAFGFDVSVETKPRRATMQLVVKYPDPEEARRVGKRGGRHHRLEFPEGSPLSGETTVAELRSYRLTHTTQQVADAMGVTVSTYHRRMKVLKYADPSDTLAAVLS